jgi:hypothetical protein
MLMRRGNTFYSRVQVPLKLQPLFGKKELPLVRVLLMRNAILA